MLTTTNHDRDSAGLTYIYPVISRRAGGLSIGINLNPNNACNWQCIYCQVPNLTRGNAPAIDLELLKTELHEFLAYVLNGTFFIDNQVHESMRQIKDIALSGNGEPTSCKEFSDVINIIKSSRHLFQLNEKIKTVLITNGSLIERAYVKDGLTLLNTINGEVWFKLDSATQEGMNKINQSSYTTENILKRLSISTLHCTTLIQSCFFKYNQQEPSEKETDDYLKFLHNVKKQDLLIKEILLYGLARPSMQPEAKQLQALDKTWFEQLATSIEAIGFKTRISI